MISLLCQRWMNSSWPGNDAASVELAGMAGSSMRVRMRARMQGTPRLNQLLLLILQHIQAAR